MEYLSIDEVLRVGTEFAGDICYSGEYGQQVYTKEIEEGGCPFTGILYEKYSNGMIRYYSHYKNGIPDGDRVKFYDSGKLKSFCVMDGGTIKGEHVELYENGRIKLKEICEYGIVLNMQEFDSDGNLIKEKKNLDKHEKAIYDKWVSYYKNN